MNPAHNAGANVERPCPACGLSERTCLLGGGRCCDGCSHPMASAATTREQFRLHCDCGYDGMPQYDEAEVRRIVAEERLDGHELVVQRRLVTTTAWETTDA